MNPYQTFTQPWRSAFAVWTVMAQAQAEMTLRLMGLATPRVTTRRAAPAAVAVPKPVTEPVVAPVPEMPAVDVAQPEAAPAPMAEVVPLRLPTEASAPAIAAATAPEVDALPEPEPEATPFVAEETAEPVLAVLAEPAHEDLVHAAVEALVEPAEPVAALADLIPEAAPAAHRPARRASSSGTRRGPKAKQGR